MNTKEFFNKHRKEKEITSTYIDGKKFNTQAGDKQMQKFYVRLLPRIPNSPSELNAGPFYEFWLHRNCGADGRQTLACLNRNREEYKANKQKCPACTKIRQIENNEGMYTKNTLDKARSSRAQNRILWPVYNLAEKQQVEFLEISGQANDTVTDQFCDPGGEFYDLTVLTNDCCLQIIRRNSGKSSKYTWGGLIHPNYKLVLKEGKQLVEDGKKIRATYKYPELVVIRLSREDFIEQFEGSFAIESTDDSVDGDVVPSAGGTGDMGGIDPLEAGAAAAAPAATGAVPGAEDLGGLDDLGAGAAPVAAPAGRQRERAAASAQPAAPAQEAASSAVADMQADLADLTDLGV